MIFFYTCTVIISTLILFFNLAVHKREYKGKHMLKIWSKRRDARQAFLYFSFYLTARWLNPEANIFIGMQIPGLSSKLTDPS